MRSLAVTGLATITLLTFVWIDSLGDQALFPYQYVSPRPGAQLVSAGTTIAVRHGEALDPGCLSSALFHVVGAESGIHPGQAVLADDKKTIVFKPDHPFRPGETVTARIHQGIRTASGDTLDGVSLHFTISSKRLAPKPYPEQFVGDKPQAEVVVSDIAFVQTQVHSIDNSTYATLPDDFPVITATVPANDTGDGYIFLSNHNYLLTKKPYLLILDNLGEPVFYKRLPGYGRALDFKKQPNGWLTYFHEETGVFHAMDSSYNMVDTIQAGNGYALDRHDLQILPNGHILLIVYDPQPIDMSSIVPGGDPNATVVGLIIQELDTSKNVVFEWRSWDHYSITDSYRDLTASWIDPFHGNAVELDHDGNILICSRGNDEITKINRQTGEIIWRMGGKNNEFTFLNDPEPTPIGPGPHDVRRVPNGNITLFDNRFDAIRSPSPPPHYSRVVEYQLDEVGKTATLIWEYRNTPDTLSYALGSAQRLSNGNTVVGWGLAYEPAMTEVKPDGTKAFELAFPRTSFNHRVFLPTILSTRPVSPRKLVHPVENTGINATFSLPVDITAQEVSYRAFRFPWHGYPLTTPTLVLHIENLTTTLYYSWNGATEIASYRVYQGRNPNPDTVIDTPQKTSFETKTLITNTLDRPCFFRVMPIDGEGHETRYSNLAFVGNEACDTAITIAPMTATNKAFVSAHAGEPITITLQIPPRAVTGTVFLVYTEIVSSPHPPPQGFVFAGVSWALDVYRDSDLRESYEFQVPVTVALEYNQDSVADLVEETLAVRYWDNASQSWSVNDITLIALDSINNRLVFTLIRGSELALLGEPLTLRQSPEEERFGQSLERMRIHRRQSSSHALFHMEGCTCPIKI